jgi:signal transduction histidine kinase
MVEGLLDAVRTRSEAVDLRRTRLDLCMFASEAAEAFRPLIAQRRQRLDVFVPPVALWVDADPVRLYQILSNLLLNASTFTPGGGRVWVHVETADDRVAVTVGDTGRGIPADTLPHIFELFVQGPGTRGRLGLGLAVVKQLTVLHGGTVEGFSDGPDCGSRFVVTLPAADDPGVPPSGSATH